MHSPLSLFELSASRYLKSTQSIPLSIAIRPKIGLFHLFSGDKVKERKFFAELIKRSTASQLALDGPFKWRGRNFSQDHIGFFRHGKCLKCFRIKVCWPIVRRLIDKDWIHLLREFQYLITDQDLMVPSLLYALVCKKYSTFFCIYRGVGISIRSEKNTLNKVISSVMRLKRRDKFTLLTNLFELYKEMVQRGDEFSCSNVLKACSVREVPLSDILQLPFLRHYLERFPEKMALIAIENGNFEFFFHIISNRPEVEVLLTQSRILKYFIASSEDIIEYIYETNPSILSTLENYIRDRLAIPSKSYRSLLEKDLRNIYRLEIFANYFSRTDTLYKLASMWFLNMKRQLKTLRTFFLFPTLFTILKSLDKFRLPVKPIGDKICLWFFKKLESNESTREIVYIINQVLPMLIEFGYSYKGFLPQNFENCTFPDTMAVFYYLSDCTVRFSPSFLNHINLSGQPRSLITLSVAAIRGINRGRWRDYVKGLTESQVLRDQILMEDLPGIISPTRRIDLKEFEEIHMENITICQNVLGEAVLGDEHKHCINEEMCGRDYEFLVEYINEDRDYYEEYPFFDQSNSSDSESSDSELDNRINSLLNFYLSQDEFCRTENILT
ncbi:DgyrCDS8365 [Dimorphilus gyrociliatus]|uniref:DgyrCDS8365 n=1 Tax=Dimorphilus gyrociliatus TaxID=2664684 RepID=A0A7I8VU53_9ANNE|nr:DgyrCDS8365 [Dimorphilus gyrociliatus]